MNASTQSGLGAIALATTLLTSTAMAQLTPDQLYYGIDRRIAMAASAPDTPNGAPAEIRLYTAPSMEGVASPEPIETASIELGRVDLAGLFPRLWQTEPAKTTTLYAQLAVNGAEIGSPVVLQPLTTPSRAFMNRQNGQMSWPTTPPTYAGIRAYVDKHVVLETTAGAIEIRLRPDQAPNTSWNFRHLAKGGLYTDVIFHRIIEKRDGRPPFVIQVGDPAGTGTGGPGYQIDLENSKLPHDFGVLSMARSPQGPDTNGSQVFLCLSRPGTEFLDGNYTAFGQSVSGAQAIVDISMTPVDAQQHRPTGSNPPKILSASLKDAPPYSQTPAPVTRPIAGADR